MIVPLLVFVAMMAVMLALAVYGRAWLLSAWIVSFLLFPTAHVKVFNGPIYLYDAMAVVVFGAFLMCRDGLRWPRGIPRWHWWFIGLAFAFSVVFQVIRFGFLLDIVWVWGHASLAWLAFAFGVVIATSSQRADYRMGLQAGFLLSAFALTGIAIIQYLDLPGCEPIGRAFYGSLGSEQSVEMLRRGLQTNRATGPHFAPTGLAGMALLSSVGFWLVTNPAEKLRRWLMIALSATTVICTVSRHAVLAAVAGLFVTILLSEARLRTRIAVAATVCGLLIGAGTVAFFAKDSWRYRLSKTEAGLLDDDNIAARVLWGPMRLAEYLGNNPAALLTGAGLESEKIAAHHSQKNLETESGFVSNGFLLALYYLGAGGFVMYCGFWGWAFLVARRFPRASRGIKCGFVAMAMVVIAADNYSFMYEPAVTLLFLVAGLIAGEQWHRQRVETLAQEAEPEADTEALPSAPQAAERYAA